MDAIQGLVKTIRPWWKEILAGLIIVVGLLAFRMIRGTREGFQAATAQADPAILCPAYILQKDALAEQRRGFEVSGNTTLIEPLTKAIAEIDKKLADNNCAAVIQRDPKAAEIVASGQLPPPPANVNEIIAQAKPGIAVAEAKITA